MALFSLLAVITSFIGFVFGLVDFWSDALGWNEAEVEEESEEGEDDRADWGRRGVLYGLTLAPPLAVAMWDPTLFFAALDNAGTYGAWVPLQIRTLGGRKVRRGREE